MTLTIKLQKIWSKKIIKHENHGKKELATAATIRYLTLGKIGDWFRAIKHELRNPQRQTSLILDRESIAL